MEKRWSIKGRNEGEGKETLKDTGERQWRKKKRRKGRESGSRKKKWRSGPENDSYLIIKEALHSLQYAILVKYFGDKEWRFHDTNTRSLLHKLTPDDSDIFNFDVKQINWTEYLENCVKGVRQYVLKDDLSTLPKARKRYKI
ncbi:hypothetical protein Cfor_06216 [Coptotermes formosanus]|uniref:Fatty acyl-CoA reductase C-terminal domain-containing protein n=1 Tax=Coptotermes formosanus TaxID=36987 RepID=A0A6L2PY70_COPFO|nr:hypothetical protein Cfor_12391 [Coptotermes formosanus]GFG40803.1 hypothetical protein Cfor_06216 [Coptotermes formosanus]